MKKAGHRMNIHFGRLAVITGASRGLGLALAKGLAGRGWDLIFDARSTDGLQLAVQEVSREAPAQSIWGVAGDIVDRAHTDALREAVGERSINLLINNAGTLGPTPLPALLDLPPSRLEEVLRVNVSAQLGVIQALASRLDPFAIIINTTSDASQTAYAGWGAYGASKAALDQLSAVLAQERPDWRVYSVDPGDMRTQMHQDAFPDEDISDRPWPEACVPGFLSLIDRRPPSGRYQAQRMVLPIAGEDVVAC